MSPFCKKGNGKQTLVELLSYIATSLHSFADQVCPLQAARTSASPCCIGMLLEITVGLRANQPRRF